MCVLTMKNGVGKMCMCIERRRDQRSKPEVENHTSGKHSYGATFYTTFNKVCIVVNVDRWSEGGPMPRNKRSLTVLKYWNLDNCPSTPYPRISDTLSSYGEGPGETRVLCGRCEGDTGFRKVFDSLSVSELSTG